jgi:hypothetical protein
MSLEPACCSYTPVGCSSTPVCGDRRRLVRSLLTLGAAGAALSFAPAAIRVAQAAAPTREQRDQLEVLT